MREGMPRATLTTVGKIRADRLRQNHIISVPGEAGWWMVTDDPIIDAHGAVVIDCQGTRIIRGGNAGLQTSMATNQFAVTLWTLVDIQCDSATPIIVGSPGV